MRLALTGFSVAALLAAAGCANETHPEYHPQSSYTLNQSVSYPTIYEIGGAGAPAVSSEPAESYAPVEPSVTETKTAARDPSHVVVVESTHLDRPTEVVGVVDVQVAKSSHDAAVAQVRQRAADLGADAVVGLEFHKGESDAEPTHVSGLAVRFRKAVRGPARD